MSKIKSLNYLSGRIYELSTYDTDAPYYRDLAFKIAKLMGIDDNTPVLPFIKVFMVWYKENKQDMPTIPSVDIPVIHSWIEAKQDSIPNVHEYMYDEGLYASSVPYVHHLWTKQDWMAYVSFRYVGV